MTTQPKPDQPSLDAERREFIAWWTIGPSEEFGQYTKDWCFEAFQAGWRARAEQPAAPCDPTADQIYNLIRQCPRDQFSKPKVLEMLRRWITAEQPSVAIAKQESRSPSKCIMDFPQAWAFVRETEMDSHDPKCSYRVAQGGFLCDCFILNDEYAKREAESRSEAAPLGKPDEIAMALDTFQKLLDKAHAEYERGLREGMERHDHCRDCRQPVSGSVHVEMVTGDKLCFRCFKRMENPPEVGGPALTERQESSKL